MSVLDTPEWLLQYIAKWQTTFFLQQWRITTKLALAPNNDANALAVCETISNTRTATLTFRADVEQTQEWEETIIHEVLHIAHATIDQSVWCMLGQVAPDTQKNMAYQAYTNEMERFIDGNSKIFWAMDQPRPLRLKQKEVTDATTSE